jgi:membrane protein YdbS with pleckstrin-like domain
MGPAQDRDAAAAIGLRRPHRKLLLYYFLHSLLLGPAFPLLFVPRLFKYRSLRYHLDDAGLAAEWGVLFRHETSLSYARIQDIHLASNLVERWLGLARIQVQTASGSSGAEMTIEGLPDYEVVRDWIYSRTRGARRRPAAAPAGSDGGASLPWPTAGPQPAATSDPVVAALRETTAELRRVRRLLEAGRGVQEAGPEPNP